MGLDYEIAYKKGNENVVADSLSRKMGEPSFQNPCLAITQDHMDNCNTITSVVLTWVQEISQSWEKDDGMKDVIIQLQLHPDTLPGYSFLHGRLKFQNKLMACSDLDLRRKFLTEFHSSPIGGHLREPLRGSSSFYGGLL